MSEKAACPRCDSYASQVYYDGCHEWCGWNCNVRYEMSVDGVDAEVVVRLARKPTDEDRERIRNAARVLGIEEDLHVSVTVNGLPPDRMSPWLAPHLDTPEPLSERRQRANLKELRDRHLKAARIEADVRFPLPSAKRV